MNLTNPSASQSATELTYAVDILKSGMQSNSALVGGASLALAAIGAGFFIGYRIYTDYKEKLHEAEIKWINELRSLYLTNIIVAEDGAKLELPAIFQKRLDPEDGWDSMHLNDQEVEALAKNSAKIPDDKELNIYRDNIARAMNDLKAYYFSYKEERRSGLTCIVLTYLMHIVDKLLKFEGYAYDIAYLDAIMQFIHFYAKGRGKDSRHNKKLSTVYAYLKTSKEELETHYATRSQLMILKELRGDCCQVSSDGIIRLARFVTDDEEALKFVNIDRLAKNILYSETVTRMLPRKILSLPKKSSGMPNCCVTMWIKTLADYWQKARNPATMVKDILPLTVLSLPEKLMEEETEHVLLLFFSETFFSRHKNEFKLAKEKLLMALSNYAKLLQLEISLVCQCNEIEGLIQNRGMMEVNNPDHCHAQYTRLGELRDKITDYVNSVKKQFAELNTFNTNPMRPQEQFLNDLKDSLDVIQKDVSLNVEAMFECRKKFKECQEKWALERQEASQVGYAIAMACELPSAYQPTVTSSMPRLSISEVFAMPAESSKESTASSALWYQPPSALPQASTTKSVVDGNSLQANRLIPPPPLRPPLSRRASSAGESSRSVVLPYHRAPKSQAGLSPRPPLSITPAQKGKQEKFMTLFESAVKARASYHPVIQLIYGMRDVLLDYTKNNSTFELFKSGAWNRTHIKTVQPRVLNITNELKTLKDPIVARQFLEKNLHELLEECPLTGTLNERIVYLVEKCREAGYHASNALIAPAVAAS